MENLRLSISPSTFGWVYAQSSTLSAAINATIGTSCGSNFLDSGIGFLAGNYYVYRSFLEFDTRFLPYRAINTVYLEVVPYRIGTTPTDTLQVRDWPGSPPITLTTYAQYGSTIYASIPTNQMTVGVKATIPLPSYAIKLGGYTRFSTRNYTDVATIPATSVLGSRFQANTIYLVIDFEPYYAPIYGIQNTVSVTFYPQSTYTKYFGSTYRQLKKWCSPTSFSLSFDFSGSVPATLATQLSFLGVLGTITTVTPWINTLVTNSSTIATVSTNLSGFSFPVSLPLYLNFNINGKTLGFVELFYINSIPPGTITSVYNVYYFYDFEANRTTISLIFNSLGTYVRLPIVYLANPLTHIHLATLNVSNWYSTIDLVYWGLFIGKTTEQDFYNAISSLHPVLQAKEVCHWCVVARNFGYENIDLIKNVLDYMDTIAALPITAKDHDQDCFCVFDAWALFNYYWAQKFNYNTLKWNASLAYSNLKTAIDNFEEFTYYYSPTSVYTFAYRCYDENCTNLRNLLCFYDFGIEEALSRGSIKADYINSHFYDTINLHYVYIATNIPDGIEWQGAYILQILNWFKNLMPTYQYNYRILEDCYNRFLINTFDSKAWTYQTYPSYYAIVHHHDSTNVRSLKRTGGAVSVLHGFYPLLNTSQKAIVEYMLTLPMWLYTYKYSGCFKDDAARDYAAVHAFNELDTAFSCALYILWSIIPKGGLLALTGEDYGYSWLFGNFDPTIFRLDLNNAVAYVAVFPGPIGFQFGGTLVTYNFPEAGKYAVQFNPSFSQIISVTKIGDLDPERKYLFYSNIVRRVLKQMYGMGGIVSKIIKLLNIIKEQKTKIMVALTNQIRILAQKWLTSVFTSLQFAFKSLMPKYFVKVPVRRQISSYYQKLARVLVSKSLQHLLRAFSERIVHLSWLNRMLVSKIRTSIYKIRILSIKRFNSIYKSLALALQTLNVKFNTKVLLTAIMSLIEKLKVNVPKTFKPIWNLKTIVQQVTKTLYLIRSRIQVLSALVYSSLTKLLQKIVLAFWARQLIKTTIKTLYLLKSTVLSLNKLLYQLRTSLSKLSIVSFNIRNIASKIASLFYSLKSLVPRQLSILHSFKTFVFKMSVLSWNLRIKLVRVGQLVYKNLGLISKKFTNLWQNIGSIFRKLIFNYIIGYLAIRLLTGIYSMRQYVVESIKSIYNVLWKVPKIFVHVFHLRTILTKIYEFRHSLRALVTKLASLVFYLRLKVLSAIQTIHSVLGLLTIETARAIKWSLLNIRSKILSFVYPVGNIVTRIQNIVYGLGAKITQFLQALYNIRLSLFSKIDLKYFLKRFSSKMLQFRYNISGFISKLFSLVYFSKSIVLKVAGIEYLVKNIIIAILRTIHLLRSSVIKGLSYISNIKSVVQLLHSIRFGIRTLRLRLLDFNWKLKTRIVKSVRMLYSGIGQIYRIIRIYYYTGLRYFNEMLAILVRSLPTAILLKSRGKFSLIKEKVILILKKILRRRST